MKDLTDKSLLEHYTGLAMQSLIRRGGHLPIKPKEAVTIAAEVVKALREHTAMNEKPTGGHTPQGWALVEVDTIGEEVVSTDDVREGQILFWKNAQEGVLKVRVEESTPSLRDGLIGRTLTVSYGEGSGVNYETLEKGKIYKVEKGLRPCPWRAMKKATVDDLVLGGRYSTLEEDDAGSLYWKDVHIASLLEGYKEDPWLKIMVRAGDGKKELVSLDDLYLDPEIPIY